MQLLRKLVGSVLIRTLPTSLWNDAALSIPVIVRPRFFETWWFEPLMILAGFGVITAVYGYRLFELRKREAMRLRIAGDLHDNIGADLSAIALKADLVGSSSTLEGQERERVAAVGELARAAAMHVREAVWVANTRYDTLENLVTKLRDATDTMVDGQLTYSFVAPEEIPDRRIGMELRRDIYLVFKEALQNVLKHSEAESVAIVIAFDQSRLTLSVTDDGRGFDTEPAPQGNGLQFIRQRAARHGAALLLTGTGGTTVRLAVKVR